jgi:hypothetical protein
MPPSKVRWGNQNSVVTVRFASRVWRYDLAKIEKKVINQFGKILTKKQKLTFSTHKLYLAEILRRDLNTICKRFGS